MFDLETLEKFWPIGAAIVGLAGYVRKISTGLALNKQSISTLEKATEDLEEKRKEDKRDIHSRLQRHEETTSATLSEIRTDIKELLRRAD